jgi:prevent-host-death family protein
MILPAGPSATLGLAFGQGALIYSPSNERHREQIGMRIPLIEAKEQLSELVRRAESGDDVVLTRHGRPVVRLVPIATRPSAEERRRVLEEVWQAGRAAATPGPSAARSQDFLYDESGLPG